jgi:Ser/Thr protein kinase RdoA (MazF antagonist)
MRQLAIAALNEYGLEKARLKFYMQAVNTLNRVHDNHLESTQANDDLYEPGQYLLRIYQPGWQADEAIRLELAWLAAMRSQADLPGPEPIPRLDGGLITHLSTPGSPQIHNCSLTRWVKGRLLPDRGRPEHYRAQGKLMARMHNFTQGWQLPSEHTKRSYDWNGLFMNDPEVGLPPGKSWEYLPPTWVEPFQSVTQQFRQLMESWGTGSEVYGLIHADMGLDSNVLFWRGQPRPIDFDGSGFGYWMYDLAVALAHCIGTPDYPGFRDALFEGYAEHRQVPEAQLDQLDPFTAAFFVYYDLRVVGGTHLHPEYLTNEMEEMMYRGAAFILQYAKDHC